MRMLLVPLLLWPVLDRVPWLIAALLTGVLAQNFTQLLQALDVIEIRPDDKRRVAGWIHPIKTGAFCAAAMCWLLAASLRGRGTFRIAAIILFVIASFGLIGTASRGTWLAAAIAIPAMLIVLAVRRPELRKMIGILCGIGAAGVAVSWPIIGDEIQKRFDVTWRELQRASDKEIYWTSVGARIGMTRWAIDIFEKHPIIGVGAGGYPKAQAAEPSFQRALDRADHHSEFMDKDHPHSIYLYTLACLGVIGAVVLLAVILTTLRQCWRDPPNHLFAEGTFFAMLTWYVGAQFDCYNLDGSRLGLFGVMVAVTMPWRPGIRPLKHADVIARPVADAPARDAKIGASA
jgi:O-antigen ligase